MLTPFWMSIVGIGLMCIWRLAISIRRWWLKPFHKPTRILKSLQRSLQLSRTEKRQLKTLLGKNADPILACQFLLDPSRWPMDSADELTRKLSAKVFKRS